MLRDELLSRGWVDKGDVLVWYGEPRLGWRGDGTLIVGWHEWPEKVESMEKLEAVLRGL